MLQPLGDCVTDVHWQDRGMLLGGKGWMQGWPSLRIFLFHSTWAPSDSPDQWCRLEGRSRTTSARKISPARENRIRTQLLPTLWWQFGFPYVWMETGLVCSGSISCLLSNSPSLGHHIPIFKQNMGMKWGRVAPRAMSPKPCIFHFVPLCSLPSLGRG